MASQVFTYSVQEHDNENMDRVHRLKEKYTKKGVSMSWVILQALKQYEKEKPNGAV